MQYRGGTVILLHGFKKLSLLFEVNKFFTDKPVIVLKLEKKIEVISSGEGAKCISGRAYRRLKVGIN